MANSYPKRLIEVDLPIRRISEYSRWEKKSITGHLKQMHLWWARRPLAACRAVMCAALWPDPVDGNCPQRFRDTAKRLMLDWANNQLDKTSPESFPIFNGIAHHPERIDDLLEIRLALLNFIGDFAMWKHSASPEFLETVRALTKIAHEVLDGESGARPLVVDPFAGGGSIPVEAVRVGADAFAGDINPVAVLLNKVALEYIPKYGAQLSEEVRRWGRWVQSEVERKLLEFYPKDSDGGTPMAYIWARTIQCEGPGCGVTVPLIRSFWLTKKSTRTAGFKLVPKHSEKRIDIEIIENPLSSDLSNPTVRRGSATCPLCGFTTPVASVRTQLKRWQGGANRARLLCVARVFPNKKGRFYRIANANDLVVIAAAERQLAENKKNHRGVLPLVPNEPTPLGGGSGAGRAFSQRIYGMDVFENLFTARQALALSTFAITINNASKYFSDVSDDALVTAIETVLALNLTKLVDLSTSLGAWEPNIPTVQHLFGRQAIGMCWDFAEGVTIGQGRGSWINYLEKMADVLQMQVGLLPGHAAQQDARHLSLPDNSAQVFFTDPPYYDAVPYADLSDLFYVWLKRTLYGRHGDLFKNELTPKLEECIVDEIKGKDAAYFENSMCEVMLDGRRILRASGIGILVFAHKSTAGWEAQLQAMINSGWVITGSWPIDTENSSRLRAQDSAALASSIHIVCRPRTNADDPACVEQIGDWRDVLQELPKRIHEWMPRLAEEGVVGADAIFACLGPALEIFSRYPRVEKASGEAVLLKEYLEHVWAAVAKEALAQVFKGADTANFESDARLTAMWLWTLNAGNVNVSDSELEVDDSDSDEVNEKKKVKARSGFVLEYDAARKIAQGLGASLEDLAHIVEISGETSRLLPVTERTQYLFGKEQVQTPVGERRKAKSAQMDLFGQLAQAGDSEAVWAEKTVHRVGETALDRVHQAMILFATGRGEALRRFLVDDGAGKDSRFWSLAQALSALYPASSTEKRWVDGVLARKKGLGL